MDDYQRLERVVEDLAIRLRAVENVDSPSQRQAMNRLERLETKVERMDTEGTHVTQVRLKALETEVASDRENKRADRRVMLGALIAAAVAVGGWIVDLVRS